MNNIDENIKDRSSKFKLCFLVIFIVLFTILRIILTCQSSIVILYSSYDDKLVVNRAISIFEGKWLGEYDHLTLVKGVGFELFLVLFNFLKISFVNAQTIMYILSCIYFVYAIRNVVKNKLFLVCIYLCMVFNPISFAFRTFQRVYRYNIIIFQVIFILSSYYLLYENITKKKGLLWPHILIATLFLAWFRLTIESYFWFMPFVFVVTILLILNTIKNKEKVIRTIIKIIIPLIGMIVLVNLIKFINYKTYGTYTYNELLESSFSDALKAIYSVDVHDDIDLVSVSQKKIEKLYEISPSLNNIKEYLNNNLNRWKSFDQNIENDEVEDGWFYWCFREAVQYAGYHSTPQKANKFYKNIADEINLAIDEGKVDSKTVMPNPLMSPFKLKYISEMIVTMSKSLIYIVNFTDVQPDIFENMLDINLNMLNKDTNNYNLAATNILIKISLIYKLNIIPFTISLIIYILLSKEYLLKHNKMYKNIWLITSACILSVLVLIAGVSYTHISAFYSIDYMYLIGAYPLIIIFELLNIFFYIFRKVRL